MKEEEYAVNVVRGYKTELDLTNGATYDLLLKHAVVLRFAYNWGLSRSKDVYLPRSKRLCDRPAQRTQSLKQTDFPWMYEVSKCAMQEAFVIWISLYELLIARRN